MTMIRLATRAVLALTRHVLPARRRDWTDPMTAEANAIDEDARAFLWSLGCLAAASNERIAAMRESGLFLPMGFLLSATFVIACYVVFGGPVDVVIEGLPAMAVFMAVGLLAIHTVARGRTGPGFFAMLAEAASGPTLTRDAVTTSLAASLRSMRAPTEAAHGVGMSNAAGRLADTAAFLVRSGVSRPERLDALLSARAEAAAQARGRALLALRALAISAFLLGAMWMAMGFVKSHMWLAGDLAAVPFIEGRLVAANWVGLVTGLFLAVWIFFPLSRRLEDGIAADREVLLAVKDAWVSHLSGAAPDAAVRFAAQRLPDHLAPTPHEWERILA